MMLIDALIAEREKRQQFSHEQALKRQMGHEVMRALSERLTAARVPGWYFLANGEEIVVVRNREHERERVGSWVLDEENRLTFALCRALLDDILLVSEAEIYRAMQALYWHDRLVTEGAAAVGAAALLAGLRPRGPTALLVTGRNVDMETFTRVVTGQPVTLGSLTLEGRPHAA